MNLGDTFYDNKNFHLYLYFPLETLHSLQNLSAKILLIFIYY